MLLRLQNAAASMTEAIRQQERLANNLANVNTAGFKQARLFVEALNERLDAERAPRSDRRLTQWNDMTQGALEHTGNPLDVAIEGDGFFVVIDETTGAAFYTRAGQFRLDAEGYLRTLDGLLVEGEEGPIQLLPHERTRSLSISQDGVLRADEREVARLRIVQFARPEALQRVAGARFTAPDQEPQPVEAPRLRPGFLESSNVNPVLAMTEMIEHFHRFETQQKIIQTTDQLLGQIIRNLGKF
ncbi:flagellar basal-body rod protein FlgF [Rhodothermus profundi]|uniref:Flagellar basal-body rod protein FlgF n=1 Tax=Rhodothermus profundi TaxID=633813 RepID=A0A1M6QD22_9BACT|nr:flagellar basal-body rod protein FlgF [Rhodothermus profundi]SHK18091.1 flagellar basal-body rod protein FlgF [Rhodothermus profundi]